jgi:hypothetical protein
MMPPPTPTENPSSTLSTRGSQEVVPKFEVEGENAPTPAKRRRRLPVECWIDVLALLSGWMLRETIELVNRRWAALVNRYLDNVRLVFDRMDFQLVKYL